MPIYVYRAKDHAGPCDCDCCDGGIEVWHKPGAAPLHKCPKCGRTVEKAVSSFSIGLSRTGFDQRAREKGFHQLKRLGEGEYEKVY
jgi:predicted nucleic acid-binding Zn ribbon protein